MRYDDSYPVFFVHDLATTTPFYGDLLGLDVLFESDFFVLFSLPGDDRAAVAFILDDHPTSPPDGTPVAPGSSAFLTLQVPDATAAFDELTRAGAAFDYSLRDEVWGQRRFGLLDPNGLAIDVVEQIEPDPEFWAAHGVTA